MEYAAELDIGFHMAISNAFWTIAMPEHGAKLAFYNDDHEIIRRLREHGANVNNVPIRGNYPTLLYATVERKSLLHARALVQLGTDLKIKDNRMRTPLFFAADFIDP